MNNQVQRIFVIGNAAGGKTRLSRQLAERYALPLTHVDSIQFLPGLEMRPFEQTKNILKDIMKNEQWIIDGYGPLDLVEERFRRADRIVFIDLPFATHVWWFIKRQLKNFWSRRPELPLGGTEATWMHTKRVYRSMRSQHRQMRPEIIKILSRSEFAAKVIHIRSVKDWRRIYLEGIDNF